MKKARKTTFWLLVCLLVTWLSASQALADGGYFSERSVAVNADQRAIIIKNGNQISMTFSTGYTSEVEDFAWVIPTPVPPAVEHVAEAGENGENLFKVLDKHTAPVLTISSGGCFPAGTEVLTDRGPSAIESIEPGTQIQACNRATGRWTLARVLERTSLLYDGDAVTLQAGDATIQATGNHPYLRFAWGAIGCPTRPAGCAQSGTEDGDGRAMGRSSRPETG